MTVIEDIIQGHRYTEDDKTGALWRVFRVDGLTSSSKIAGDALYAQSEVSAARVPRAGETHPTMANFICRAVEVRPSGNSKTAMWIVCTYIKVKRRLLDMRVNGVSVPTVAQLDERGAVIEVGYKVPNSTENAFAPDRAKLTPPAPPDRRNGDGWVYNKGQTTGAFGSTTYEVIYMEETGPGAKIDLFMNKLNATAWNGGLPREWLCRSISAYIDSPMPRNLGDLPNQDVIDGGNALFFWVTSYLFEKRPIQKFRNGLAEAGPPPWDELLIYTDPITGERPSDINPQAGGYPTNDTGNGWRAAKRLASANFDELKVVTFA